MFKNALDPHSRGSPGKLTLQFLCFSGGFDPVGGADGSVSGATGPVTGTKSLLIERF